jgi:hypothetical protein
MNIEAKLTGLDEFKEFIQSSIKESMMETGEDALKVQKEKSDYLNHTFNLRNAPGYAVTIEGKEVARNVPTDGGHAEAEVKTNKTLDKANKLGTGLIIADGMEYASFVSSKGYDVIDSGLLQAHKILNEKAGK